MNRTYTSVQFSSVQLLSCVRLCDPLDCSTPGLPVHHQLPEYTQTHVHHIDEAIQPAHPLSSPSPPTFSLSQHQGLFQGTAREKSFAETLFWKGQTEYPQNQAGHSIMSWKQAGLLSVLISESVSQSMSDSLRPHGILQARILE